MAQHTEQVLFVPIVASVNLRDVVASGVLKELQTKNPKLRIVVLSALPVTEGIRKLFKGVDVTFDHIPEVEFKPNSRAAQLRRLRSFIFALANPKLRTVRVTIGTFKSGTYGEKKPWVYYLFHFVDFFNNKYVAKIYNGLRRKLMKAEISFTEKEDAKYQKLFDKYRPTMVLSQAPYARAQLPVQRTAIRNNVPIVGIINSWDNATSSSELIMKLDHLLVWSDHMKKEYVDYHMYKPSEITVCGALQFDHYFNMKGLRSRAAFCKALGLDPKKKIITYTLSSELLFPNEHLVVKDIADIMQSEAFKDCQLLIRIYPTNEKVESYKKLERKGVIVHHPANMRLQEERYLPNEEFIRTLIETMKYSEYVLNYPSTIILDAAIYSKPTINIRYDPTNEKDRYKNALRFYEYDHIHYVTDMHATVLADSKESLEKEMKRLLRNPKVKQQEMKAFQKKIAGAVDGKTYKRVAAAITELMR